MFARFVDAESGSTAVEYALVAAGIAVAIMASISMVSCSLKSVFSDVAAMMKAS